MELKFQPYLIPELLFLSTILYCFQRLAKDHELLLSVRGGLLGSNQPSSCLLLSHLTSLRTKP